MSIEIPESRIRSLIRDVLSEQYTTSAGSSQKVGDDSSSYQDSKISASDEEKIGKFDTFELDSDIHPNKWDNHVAKVFNKLKPATQKFIKAVPAAVAALGFARNESHAYKVANSVVGSTYRTGKQQAAAMYGGPYMHDLEGRVNGVCKPGSYYFAGGDTCSTKPGGVYPKDLSRGGPYEEIFNRWEEITGFGEEPDVPKNWKAVWKKNRKVAAEEGEKIFFKHYGKKEHAGGHSGSAIDVPLGDGYPSILDKAAELSGTKISKFKEVDHIHATISENRDITKLIFNVIREQYTTSAGENIDLGGTISTTSGRKWSQTGGDPGDGDVEEADVGWEASDDVADNYADRAKKLADITGVPPAMIYAIESRESSHRPSAFAWNAHIFRDYLKGRRGGTNIWKSVKAKVRAAGLMTKKSTYKRDAIVNFKRAYAIDPKAAIAGGAWGLYQVLGVTSLPEYNNDPESFMNAWRSGAAGQIEHSKRAFIKWVRNRPDFPSKAGNFNYGAVTSQYYGDRKKSYEDHLKKKVAQWKGKSSSQMA